MAHAAPDLTNSQVSSSLLWLHVKRADDFPIFAVANPWVSARCQVLSDLPLDPLHLPITCCPFSAHTGVYPLVTKLSHFYTLRRTQPPHFQHLPSSCAIFVFLKDSPVCYQRLTDSLCSFLTAFCASNLLFSMITELFVQKHRG